jgi:hypothetical protein
MILIALAGAHLRAQTSSPTSGPIETIAPKTTANSADLPDSPGTTLRRRIPPADESGETASAADQSLIPQQVAGSTSSSSTAGSPAGSSTMTGAEARASDTRGIGNCLAATRATQGGIIELKSYTPNAGPDPAPALTRPLPACPPAQALNPYQRFLNSGTPIPLTPRQKAYLAVHNFIDPGNIVTIIGTSGVAIATDSHTAYGPGWRGFGRDAGISAVQDATGDFFGTFLIPSLTHEDPHYHRMPNASIPRRTLHAISRTVIAQSDDGHPMPNYATLLTYPITAEIANLYVPGIASNGPSTVERVLTGYATDPIDNLITEFLPDVAKRIHVRVIFVQQIINQVAAGQPVTMFP